MRTVFGRWVRVRHGPRPMQTVLYTFAADVNVYAGKIVSLGGTDITTGAAITILSAEAGSQYITPISTAYVSAGSSGATLLA